MNRMVFLLLICVSSSCTLNQAGRSDNATNADAGVDHLMDPGGQDTIVLYEDRILHVQLPFERRDMLGELTNQFNPLNVTREMGQQDGPDFPFYSVKSGDHELCFFAMNWEDTLNLDQLYIKQPIIKDEYGLKVGDGYREIKKLRGNQVKTYTDYHQHTFAYVDSSRIMYEISGDVFIADTVDLETLKFTEEQLKDWKIEHLIWRN